jgi:hypothetical protein
MQSNRCSMAVSVPIVGFEGPADGKRYYPDYEDLTDLEKIPQAKDQQALSS